MIDNGGDNGDHGQDDDTDTNCEREWDEDKNTGRSGENEDAQLAIL